MTIALSMQEKYELLKLKVNIGARSDRKKLGITTVEEHKKLLNEEMELISGKTYEEIMNGTVKEYNQIVEDVNVHDFKLDLMKKGLNYQMYYRNDLIHYLDNDGKVNKEKVQRCYEKAIENGIYDDMKKGKLKETLNINFKEYEDLRQRKDLLQYFPYVSKISENEKTNDLILEFDYVDVETRNIFNIYMYKYDFYLYKDEYLFLDEGAKKIKGQIDEYARRCGYEEFNNITYYDWNNENEAASVNFQVAYSGLAIGKQHYINYCLDQIDAEDIKNELKNYRFTTLASELNPILDAGTVGTSAKVRIKYQELGKRIYRMEYNVHEPIIDQMIAEGYSAVRMEMVDEEWKEVE